MLFSGNARNLGSSRAHQNQRGNACGDYGQIREGVFEETMVPNTRGAAEVATNRRGYYGF